MHTTCVLLCQVKWRNIQFIMWDIGGQESLRQAWSTYFSGTHFLILVVDSTDRERLSVTKEELYRMLGNEVGIIASDPKVCTYHPLK